MSNEAEQPRPYPAAVLSRAEKSGKSIQWHWNRAIRLMAMEGKTPAQAAAIAGLTEPGIQQALKRSDVRAAYLGLIEEWRISQRGRNLHALAEIRDSSGNDMAKLKAIAMLNEQTAAHEQGKQQAPGVVIQMVKDPDKADQP